MVDATVCQINNGNFIKEDTNVVGNSYYQTFNKPVQFYKV